MSEPSPSPEESVDALVRAYLDRQASQVDVGPALDRIREAMGRPRPKVAPRRKISRRWALGAVAASILLGSLGVLYLQPKQANAETIIRQSMDVHSQPMDRCYRVEIQAVAEFPDDGFPRLARPRRTRLWTRGDRFWIESDVGLLHLNWGRDPEGTLWLALSPRRGIRFDPDEVPPVVAFRCDVLSVRLETLLGELPRNFELRSEPGPGFGSQASTIIRTVPRPGRWPILREAELEIDSETKVIRRMVLTRVLNGQAITTTFTLEETATLENSSYQLEGHLESPYLIFRRDFEPQRRRQLLLRLFGVRPGEISKDRGSPIDPPPMAPDDP
ncbi:hypothetical protein P12x_002034 [Tundrisphaera lichenicola]|uniref:hypothetical protein n=1 Tax=Tundrisphaera lichenicola TaxID=2029860 RepID=UPI003EBA984C